VDQILIFVLPYQEQQLAVPTGIPVRLILRLMAPRMVDLCVSRWNRL